MAFRVQNGRDPMTSAERPVRPGAAREARSCLPKPPKRRPGSWPSDAARRTGRLRSGVTSAVALPHRAGWR